MNVLIRPQCNILINLFSIIIAVLPALSLYNFIPGMNFGIFLYFTFFIAILPFIKISDISFAEWQLFLGALSITFAATFVYVIMEVRWFNINLMVNNLFSIVISFIPLIFAVKKVNKTIFRRSLLVVGSLASIVVIWQRIELIVFGNFYQDLFLPGLEVIRDVDEMSLNRPSAFFSEPAHLSIYLMPIFYLSLLDKKFFFSLLFLGGILFCGSSTGFISLIVVILFYIYQTDGNYKFIKIIGLLILMILGYLSIFLLYPQILLENIDKIEGVGEGHSDIRLLGPLEYLRFFDVLQWSFGLTLNQLEAFLRYNNYVLTLGNANYANGFIYMLLSYGIIGFLLLLRYLILRSKAKGYRKGFWLIFVLILSSDQILFNSHFIYLISFMLIFDVSASENFKTTTYFYGSKV